VRRIVTVVLLCVWGLSTPALATPSQSLARARAEFDRGNWKRVIAALEPELYPRALIRDEEELKEAYYLLGAAFFYDKKPDRTRQAFTALLYLDPERSLDPATESPEVYAFFETVKGELRSSLDEIRKQKQKQRDDEVRQKPSREILIERTIHPPGSPLSNFVPFGYAQFRNGDRGLGTFFLVSQGVTGGVSLGLFTYQALAYGIPAKYDASTDASTLRTLQYVQVATGAAFLVVYGWSVIDGFMNQKPRIEEKRSERPIPASSASTFQLVPMVTGAADGVGASAVWRF
jgi:hypothetical protein